jgi:signal transduction histidine kinase
MAGAVKEGDPPRDIVHALRWLAERSPAPLLVTEGPAHLVRHANPALLALLAGEGAASPANRPFAEAFPELPHAAHRALLDLVYATGEPKRTPDFERVDPRRGPRVLALCIWPALDEGDGPRHLVIEVCDSTEQARELHRGRELAEETRRINERLVVAGVRMQELADEAERARGRLAILAEVGGVLGAAFDASTMLPAVARLLVPHLVDVCAVDLLDCTGAVALTAIEPEVVTRDAARAIAAARARALTSDDSLVGVIAGDDAGNEDFAQELRALGFASGVAIPLRGFEPARGVLTVLSLARLLDPADVTLVEEITDRITMAIERVDLYQKALSAARAREELLATVSHDLRSPLSTILFGAALLEKCARASSPEARHLERIRRTVEYMQRLLSDLVDSAKIDAHRFLVDREPSAVAPLVSDVVEMMQPLAASKSVQLSADLDASAASSIVWMDRARMAQVLINLVANAVKFTPERGSVAVRVEAQGDEVVFSVRDTGPGIPREDLARLFDRFWQARKTAQLGTGLGLFIAKGIVLAHGGAIRVASELGVGSTFFVTLPAGARSVDQESAGGSRVA